MSIEEIINRLDYLMRKEHAKNVAFPDGFPLDEDVLWNKAALREAIDLLKTHPDAQPNEPLTLEELREMGGYPYWHVGLQKDSPPPHWNILEPFYAEHINDYGYGKRWLAYRRPPKEN